jgi:glycosyltransferase involved in cell wall biosynthesis
VSISTAPVTVIVPCLNAEDTLGEAIASALNQTAPPIEVLVIDDGSTDGSVAVAKSFGSKVRVLRNPERGPGAARKIGVIEARGTFIGYVDADDTIEATKHEKQLAVLENSDPHTLVHTDTALYWPDGSQPERRRGRGHEAVGRCTQTIFETNPVCGASTMLRRSVILELGNYRSELFGTEDLGMSLVASTCCDFVYIEEPLYRIRRHDANITRRWSHMAVVHWLAQDYFRRQCPDAFEDLPEESVQQYMIDPVLQAARRAYWQREPRDYHRLLELAVSLAPEDSEIQRFLRRRHVPMWAMRLWDRVSHDTTKTAMETA